MNCREPEESGAGGTKDRMPGAGIFGQAGQMLRRRLGAASGVRGRALRGFPSFLFFLGRAEGKALKWLASISSLLNIT